MQIVKEVMFLRFSKPILGTKISDSHKKIPNLHRLIMSPSFSFRLLRKFPLAPSAGFPVFRFCSGFALLFGLLILLFFHLQQIGLGPAKGTQESARLLSCHPRGQFGSHLFGPIPHLFLLYVLARKNVKVFDEKLV